jgi:hypothetical protein
MIKEKQRIKIAELCGWKPDDDGAGLNTWEASWVGNKLYGLRPSFRDDGTIASYTVDCLVPDYPNSLDAMHKAEKALFARNDWSACKYEEELQKMTTSWAWYATAVQRAEIFLKTMNAWEEEP